MELYCHNVLWTDRKSGFLNRLVKNWDSTIFDPAVKYQDKKICIGNGGDLSP